MYDNDYQQHLKEKIAELRKSHSLTQEQLADKMGISYQAVSKWENGVACPDIMFLPKLAKIFDVTIDSLFFDNAVKDNSMHQTPSHEMPWEDDDVLHVAVYEGHRLLKDYDSRLKEFTFRFDGDIKDLDSVLSVSCNNVSGHVNAGDNVDCQEVQGNVTAGDSVNCGNVQGDVSAGDNVNCGNVRGNVSAGDNVSCGNVQGNVTSDDVVAHNI